MSATSIGVGLAALTAAATVRQSFLHWRAHGRADVRRALGRARELFATVVAKGGLTTRAFRQPDLRDLDLRLGDLVGIVHDRNLRQDLVEVNGALKDASRLAPPPMMTLYTTDDIDRPESSAARARRERLAGQIDVAHRGLEEVATAMERLNRLERFLVLRA